MENKKRLIAECEVENGDYPNAKGLDEATVKAKLGQIIEPLREKKFEKSNIDLNENRSELLRLLQ